MCIFILEKTIQIKGLRSQSLQNILINLQALKKGHMCLKALYHHIYISISEVYSMITVYGHNVTYIDLFNQSA